MSDLIIADLVKLSLDLNESLRWKYVYIDLETGKYSDCGIHISDVDFHKLSDSALLETYKLVQYLHFRQY